MSEVKREVKRAKPGIGDALLKLNDLKYMLPPEISIATKRTFMIDQAQQNSYTGGQVIFTAQTGSSFVNPRDSFLRFTFTADEACTWGQGSAMNVIREVIVKSRTGTEVSRVTLANILRKNVDYYNMSRNWINAVGGLQGYPKTVTSGSLALTSYPRDAATSRIYTIPLSHIAPIFDTDKLLPPQLCEGMRIELWLETTNNTVTSGATPVTTYTLSIPRIHWNIIDLADQFKMKINQMASKGLNLLHKEWFHQPASAASAAFNIEVRKAASKALKAYVVSRPNSNLNSSANNVDAMASEAFKYATLQANIGADYFPQTRVESASTSDWTRFYQYTLQGVDKMGPRGMVAPPYVSYDTYGTVGNDIGNMAAFVMSFNKSTVTDLAGYQVNNSRVIQFNITYTDSTDRSVDIWLQFVRLVKVFTNGVNVKD